MSPLTPTLPKTQTLIPTGSFAELPDFATKVQEALSLVNLTDMEVVVQKKQEIEQQKDHLTTLLEELKESQKDYDFSDYEERLLLSDAEIETILELELFRKDGVLTELGKSFYKYLELLTEGKSEELKGKMKRKLVKELKLEDRVYESSKCISGLKESGIRPEFNNKEQFFQEIKAAGASGKRNLNLQEFDLSEKFDATDFLELVQTTGASGIKMLNISRNSISTKLNVPDILILAQKAGKTGIRSLSIEGNDFHEKLDVPDFLELVQKAGESGIRNLDLGYNHLFKKLDATDFLELVQKAGESGVKSLNLSDNMLLSKFNTLDFLELVQKAGESGIRNLGLLNSRLLLKFNFSDLFEMIQRAGKSGIRSLNILEHMQYVQLINSFEKQKLKNMAKQYNMKLIC
ncbi:MAG: hypothetical protein PHH70_02765 [Candidatus Gracilibacteria bacterium]|nr:hypothetical protein [Candidatus Gracilibacteria bacterium]